MKKRFALYGMFAAMAIFATACGDDSSSGPEEESSSSIEVEDESSSSVEEEGKSSAADKKSSSSEAKKGDSSSSEKTTSSSSAAVSSSSEISYEPTCVVKMEGSVASVETHFYATDMGGDVEQVMVVDYDNYTVSSTLDFAVLGVTSCEEAKLMLGEQVKSCSAENKTVSVVSTIPSEYFEPTYGTLANAKEAICGGFLSEFIVDTTALNQEMLAAGKYGTFRDTRDAMLYRTIKIGNQTWMAQNLLYETESGSVTNGYERFYTWETATGVCPTGWDLPTKADYEDLILLLDDEYKSIEGDNSEFDFEKAKDLVSANTGDELSGNDRYGFSIVAAGHYDLGYQDRGISASFWTKTSSSSYAYALGITSEFKYAAMMFSTVDDSRKKTIRCIKDDAPSQSVSSN